MPSRKYNQRKKDDPNFPKPPLTTWEQFAHDSKEVVKQRFVPGDSAADIVKLLQDHWLHGLSEKQRMKCRQESRKRQILYELVCKEYIKDKTCGPKRPPTAFFLFCQDVRESVKKANPNAGVTEMAKLLGQKWGALNSNKKATYISRSVQLKEAWKIKKKAYDDAVGKRRTVPTF